MPTMSESPITKSFELAKLGSAAPRTFHTVVTIAGAPAKVIADCEVDMTPTEVADAGGVAPLLQEQDQVRQPKQLELERV